MTSSTPSGSGIGIGGIGAGITFYLIARSTHTIFLNQCIGLARKAIRSLSCKQK